MTSMDETHAPAESALVAQLRRLLAYWLAVTIALSQRVRRAEQQLAEAHRQTAAAYQRTLDAEAELAALRQRNTELLRDRDQCHSAAAKAADQVSHWQRRALLSEQALRLGIARPDPLEDDQQPGLLRRCADRVLAPFRGTGAW